MADRPEDRIPCPLCGGLVHPVAGRCKHCKGDLVALRTGKPQAHAALPALGPRTNEPVEPRPPAPHVAPQHLIEQAARAYVATGPMVFPPDAPRPAALDPSTATFSRGPEPARQVLPPRPTGRMFAAQAPSAPVWPVIVIVIATLAVMFSIAAIVVS